MSGLGEVPPVIRPGRVEDAPACARIEAACARQFAESPQAWVASQPVPPAAIYAEAASLGRLEVLETYGTLAGFSILVREAKSLHVAELDVDPRFQRRGFARALLDHAARRARSAGLTALTLTTFRDVAWNGPAYARMGFREMPVSEWTGACREEFAHLVEVMAVQGRDASSRMAMIRVL